METTQLREPGRKAHRGWIEAVVVVACLGLLVAMAIPQQRALGSMNRRTEVGALLQSLQSAAELGHSLWVVQGRGPVVETSRATVAMVNGYPAAGDIDQLVEKPETMAFTRTGGRWQHRDRGEGHPCGLRYSPPPRDGGSPLFVPELSGC